MLNETKNLQRETFKEFTYVAEKNQCNDFTHVLSIFNLSFLLCCFFYETRLFLLLKPFALYLISENEYKVLFSPNTLILEDNYSANERKESLNSWPQWQDD